MYGLQVCPYQIMSSAAPLAYFLPSPHCPNVTSFSATSRVLGSFQLLPLSLGETNLNFSRTNSDATL